MLIGGREGPAFEQVGFLSFSPDSRHVAYSAMEKGKWFMTMDGKTGAKYDAVLIPIYSPDSAHLAYGAQKMASGWSLRMAQRAQLMKRLRRRS